MGIKDCGWLLERYKGMIEWSKGIQGFKWLMEG